MRGTSVNVVAEAESEGILVAMKKEPNKGLVMVIRGKEGPGKVSW